PHHGAVALIADEHLLLERPELAAGDIADDAAGRFAHLAVGKDDGRRHQLGDFLGLDHDPAARLGVFLPRAHVRGVRIPFVPLGMPLERAGLEELQAAGAVPRALVIGVEDVAVVVEADAAGRADAAAGGRHLAITAHAQAPAAELHVAG